MKSVYARSREKIAEINGQIEESLSGIRVVKSFANEELENQKFKVGNDGFLESKRARYHVMAEYMAGINGFTTLLNVTTVIVGAYLIAAGYGSGDVPALYRQCHRADSETGLLHRTVSERHVRF